MAQRKSTTDVLRSEKYFEDAVFSAFLNLHKAAKKKSEYIWATQKFSSFDSIWGEPVQKTNVLDSSNEASGNREFESTERSNYDSYKGHSFYQKHGSNRVEKKMPENTPENSFQNQKVFVSRKVSLLQNFSNDNKGKNLKSENSIPVNEIPDLKVPKQKSFNQILNASKQERIELEKLKRNQDVDCKITGAEYTWNREVFQNKASTPDMSSLETKNQSQHPFGDAEKASRLPSFANSSVIASNAEENKHEKLHCGESEFQRSCIKGKLNHFDTPRKEQTLERNNRKRPMSPVTVLYPEQRHSNLEDQEGEMIHDSNKRNDMSKSMLQVKIFKSDQVFDFTIEKSNFDRIKKRFPKLQEVFPEIDEDEKELSYSADAVKIILGYMCNLRYPKPDERTAIEVLAASKSWEMHEFYYETKLEFSKKVTKNNIIAAYRAAVHYGLKEMCAVYKHMLSDDLPSNDRPYRPRKCYISIATFIEPREFCVPLKTSASTLHDNFNRDIRNEIIFKAVAGSYVITGFQILLNIDNQNETNSNLEFDYVVRNSKSSHEEELKVSKPMHQNIVIYLKRSLIVNEDETAEIVFESSIKPYLCYAIKEDNLVGYCDQNKFCLKMTSTYKVANSTYKRFFIGKLLYHPKA